MKGHIPIVEFLLANKANVDAADKNKKTPLHVAIEKDNLQMVEFLVKAGANIESQESTKNSAY